MFLFVLTMYQPLQFLSRKVFSGWNEHTCCPCAVCGWRMQTFHWIFLHTSYRPISSSCKRCKQSPKIVPFDLQRWSSVLLYIYMFFSCKRYPPSSSHYPWPLMRLSYYVFITGPFHEGLNNLGVVEYVFVAMFFSYLYMVSPITNANKHER